MKSQGVKRELLMTLWLCRIHIRGDSRYKRMYKAKNRGGSSGYITMTKAM